MSIISWLMVLLAAAAALAEEGQIQPGEERIVFSAVVDGTGKINQDRKRRGDYEIFSVRTDGTGLIRLTDNDLDDCKPHWCGGRIVFERGSVDHLYDPEEHPWEIWIMDADGNNRRRLATTPKGAMWVCNPWISPDGTRLVYCVGWQAERENGDRYDYYLFDLHNLKTTRLNLPAKTWGNLYWSPDGCSLTFSEEGNHRLCAYDLQTGCTRTLLAAPNGVVRRSARLSPDGTKLIFQQSSGKEADGHWELRILDVDSGEISEPIASGYDPYNYWRDVGLQPVWSPDGKWIYFHKSCEDKPDPGPLQLYRVAADGSAGVEKISGLPETGGDTAYPNVARVEQLFELSVCLTVESREEGRVLLLASPCEGEDPFTFIWNLAEGADWVELTPDGDRAVLEFSLPSSCTVEVTVFDTSGRKGSARLAVAPSYE